MYYTDGILTDTQRQALTESGAVFHEITIGTEAFRRHGIGFPRESMDQVVRILDLLPSLDIDAGFLFDHVSGAAYSDEFSRNGYIILQLQPLPDADRPVVILEDPNYHNGNIGRQFIAAMTEAYPELGMGMIVRAHRRTASDFVCRRGLIQINLESFPAGLRYEDVFGADGFGRLMRVIGSTRDYFVVRNTDNRYVALFQGDVNGGTLWTLFNSTDSGNAKEIMAYIMHCLARHLHPEMGSAVDLATYRSQAALRSYLATARRRLEQEIRDLPDTAAAAERSEADALRIYMAAVRTSEHSRRLLNDGVDENALLEELSARMIREFEALAQSPDFESISFSDNRMTVLTRPLELVHHGLAYELGRYRFDIDMNNSGMLSITSQGQTSMSGYSHPHVSGGRPCFGNQRENFSKLLATHQYAVVLPLIVMYLETGYQPADSYISIEGMHLPTRALQEATA